MHRPTQGRGTQPATSTEAVECWPALDSISVSYLWRKEHWIQCFTFWKTHGLTFNTFDLWVIYSLMWNSDECLIKVMTSSMLALQQVLTLQSTNKIQKARFPLNKDVLLHVQQKYVLASLSVSTTMTHSTFIHRILIRLKGLTQASHVSCSTLLYTTIRESEWVNTYWMKLHCKHFAIQINTNFKCTHISVFLPMFLGRFWRRGAALGLLSGPFVIQHSECKEKLIQHPFIHEVWPGGGDCF